jgi:hypothetical protein
MASDFFGKSVGTRTYGTPARAKFGTLDSVINLTSEP